MNLSERIPLVGKPEPIHEPFLDRAARWAVDFDYRDIPGPIRRAGNVQRTDVVGAALWTRTHSIGDQIRTSSDAPLKGDATRIGGGSSTPKTAAAENAALATALECSGSILGGSTGPSTVFVPIAYAEAHGLGARQALTAQIAANEIAGRLGATTTTGPFSGPNAGWIHATGAAVGRALLEGDDPETLADALFDALARSCRPIGKSTPALDDRDSVASDSIGVGLDAVERARAGISGRRDLIEGEDGLLASLTNRPATAYLSGLGDRWHTAALSVSAVPGPIEIAAAVEAALEPRGRFDRGRTSVDRVDVYGSSSMLRLDANAEPSIEGRGLSLDSRLRSVRRAVATALVVGDYTPREINAAPGTDVERIDARVRLRHDPELTIAGLQSHVPEGVDFTNTGRAVTVHTARTVGLAGTLRHLPTVIGTNRRLVTPAEPSVIDRRIGARVVVLTTDGREIEATVDRPQGAAGGPPAERRAIARSKCRRGLQACGWSEPDARTRTDRLLSLDERSKVRLDWLLDDDNT